MSLKQFAEKLTLDKMEIAFKGRNWCFQDQGVGQRANNNNMFIFDEKNPTFIIHFKVEDFDKSVQVFLMRRKSC